MNGPQDIGGKQGFGPVLPTGPEPAQPVFHSDWERKVFALSFCSWITSGVAVDESRAHQVGMPYDRYYGSSYYERWLYSLERLLVEKGVANEDEIESGKASGEAPPPTVAPGELTAAALGLATRGIKRSRDAPAGPGYVAGDEVRAKNVNPRSYDRLPTYLKGHRGTIDEYYGPFIRPEDLAAGKPDEPGDHCYRVRFAATELWGESAEGRDDAVCVDLFESYLEPA